MTYSPRHAALDAADEWDGTDPLTALEDEVTSRYADCDRKARTRAATGRENRKHMRQIPAQSRRKVLASKRIFGHPVDDTSGMIENLRVKGIPHTVTPGGGVVIFSNAL